MSLTIIIDGQYGSTGKGKCAVHLAQTKGCALALRSGGPNAGHSIFVGNLKHVCRQLPSPIAVPGVRVAIAAGGMVDANLLERELEALEELGITDVRGRLWIDPMASVVEDDAGDQERGIKLGDKVGSTQTGTGWTQSKRALREARIARDIMALRPYLHDVTMETNKFIDQGKNVIIEGTQGFGLSLYHGGFYPQCTSRDTSASGFASECGVSPRLVSEIWMVLRTWPIRVGGNSGPLANETTWEYVRDYSGRTEPLVEMTSVTKKVRRVGLFDWSLLQRAIMVNRPTHIAVHGLDYLDCSDAGKTDYAQLGKKSKGFLTELQIRTKIPVGMAFTGPHQKELVDYIPFPGQVASGQFVDALTGKPTNVDAFGSPREVIG